LGLSIWWRRANFLSQSKIFGPVQDATSSPCQAAFRVSPNATSSPCQIFDPEQGAASRAHQTSDAQGAHPHWSRAGASVGYLPLLTGAVSTFSRFCIFIFQKARKISAIQAMSRAVVLLVPFREDPDGARGPQLAAFLKHFEACSLHRMPGVQVHVFVAQQSDDGHRFNKGQLLNAGFELACKSLKEGGADTTDALYIFHDVDMLPADEILPKYVEPMKQGSMRLVEAGWQRYNSEGCFGGVVIFSEADYRATNGFPNDFWGWGGEDNAQYARVRNANLEIERISGGAYIDLEQVDIDQKLENLGRFDGKCKEKWKKMKLDREGGWKRNGLSSLQYQLLEETSNTKNVTTVTIELKTAMPGTEECQLCQKWLEMSKFSSQQLKHAAFVKKYQPKCVSCIESSPEYIEEVSNVQRNKDEASTRLTCKSILDLTCFAVTLCALNRCRLRGEVSFPAEAF
jgi:hypothetical protein